MRRFQCNCFLRFYDQRFLEINQGFLKDFNDLLVIDRRGDSSDGPLAFGDRNWADWVLVPKNQRDKFFERLEVKSLVDPTS